MKEKNRNSGVGWLAAAVWIWSAGTAGAQAPTLEQVVERLNRVEQENSLLRAEVAELRERVQAMSGPAGGAQVSSEPAGGQGPAVRATVEERLDIAERRIEEQAQTKVEASQRLPVRLTGMLLANVSRGGAHSGGNDIPTTASAGAGRRPAGLTFRQSIIGMEYQGAQTVLGARVRGALFADFFEGFMESPSGYSPFRIRTASVGLDWDSTSVSFGIDKPLFSPRDPNSYSFVGVSPLTGAGNLWRWQPQVRVEHRFALSRTDRLRAQGAIFQTYEELGVELGYHYAVERRRPGLQGRLEYSHLWDEERRIAIAPAFHVSTTHTAGASVPSRLLSVDWFANPWSKLEVSGTVFGGRNVHHFGALRQSYTIDEDGRARPVHSRGGWAQLSFPVTPRVTLNVFGGMHDDRNRDLAKGIGVNRSGAANIQYRIAPNVIVSLEAMQVRTDYLRTGLSKNNRYDLGVAYLF